MYILGFKKPIELEFNEHIDYGFVCTSSNSSIAGNYVYFNGDVDPTTRRPQANDKFCVAKDDMSMKYFLYQGGRNVWGMFENDGRSPTAESDETDRWPWEDGIVWSYGDMPSDTTFEFKKIRWCGMIKYVPAIDESLRSIYSYSDLTLDPQESLGLDKVWLNQESTYHNYKVFIQQDDDGFRWYLNGYQGNTTVNRTYHAKAGIEELGWPWDNYDWYDVSRDYWQNDGSYFDFRNMDKPDKVNEGPYNWTITVTNGSNSFKLTCKNQDPNGTLMPYARFVGTNTSNEEVILRLMTGSDSNTMRWVLQQYGQEGSIVMANENVSNTELKWPWDSSITWDNSYSFAKD